MNSKKPLAGKVTVHLQDTFTDANPTVMARNGVARLTLVACGAFTVGAECGDQGRTKLELGLAEVENAPAEFRVR